ncbi:MAG: hypothetical protein NTZ17_22590, partial [Phycisphaerae bacterium]|nr:hypothetical protein [Phycisphaerae bacterium]
RGLGVRVPITGSNIASDEAYLRACDAVDFTDHHEYWDHPAYKGGNEDSLNDEPLVRADLTRRTGLVNGLSIGKVAGKPADAKPGEAKPPESKPGQAKVK